MDLVIADYGLRAAYILVILAAIVAVVMPIIKSVQDPKSIIGSLVGIAVLVVVYFIGYALAGDEVTPKYMEFDVDSGMSKLIGGALTMFYIMLVVAFLGIIYTEVSKLFK
ncbi:hypothetical protein [Flexithrix dorotheae]|uniref:hypothetical protein n=1 Tax=Flexithrix dorotheae TaxID=70993 RepID=UPI0003671BE3|nr:hypothetical protein [Flexithrix dorotheae]